MIIQMLFPLESNWETLNLDRILKDWERENSEEWLSWKMELDMKESGYLVLKSDKDKEFKFGQMDQCMRDGGKKIKLMEKED